MRIVRNCGHRVAFPADSVASRGFELRLAPVPHGSGVRTRAEEPAAVARGVPPLVRPGPAQAHLLIGDAARFAAGDGQYRPPAVGAPPGGRPLASRDSAGGGSARLWFNVAIVEMSAMRLGVQQPYFFPYLGYYQLLFAVDRFVAYDDVAWINGGWIHRNRLLAQGRPAWFTIPTRGAGPSVSLDAVRVAARDRGARRCCARSSSRHACALPAPVLAMLERVLGTTSPFVADFAVASLETVRDYLGYATPIHRARNRYEESAARGQDRIIAICRAENVTEYVNAIGGSALYDHQAFQRSGITLDSFAACHSSSYPRTIGPSQRCRYSTH